MRPDDFDTLSRSLSSSASRRNVLKLVGVGVAATAVAVGFGEATAQSEGDNPFADIAVSGTDATGDVVFTGIVNIKKFVARNEQIFALGQLTGTLTKNGNEKRVKRGVRLPVELVASAAEEGAVTAQQVACGILDLTLGPLDLNLLGLRIQLSQIDLVITAIPGGGLLGDLLCAIADLLNPLGSLRQLVRLLNRLLDFFN
jgi:hypothetical protein